MVRGKGAFVGLGMMLAGSVGLFAGAFWASNTGEGRVLNSLVGSPAAVAQEKHNRVTEAYCHMQGNDCEGSSPEACVLDSYTQECNNIDGWKPTPDAGNYFFFWYNCPNQYVILGCAAHYDNQGNYDYCYPSGIPEYHRCPGGVQDSHEDP